MTQTDLQMRIIRRLQAEGALDRVELRKLIGVNRRDVKEAIADLEGRGVVTKVQGTLPMKFRLVDGQLKGVDSGRLAAAVKPELPERPVPPKKVLRGEGWAPDEVEPKMRPSLLINKVRATSGVDRASLSGSRGEAPIPSPPWRRGVSGAQPIDAASVFDVPQEDPLWSLPRNWSPPEWEMGEGVPLLRCLPRTIRHG